MPSCRETTRLLSDSMETRLSFGRRLGLRLHLVMCHLCRRYAKQIRLLDRIARTWDRSAVASPADDAVALSARARERMRARLREES